MAETSDQHLRLADLQHFKKVAVDVKLELYVITYHTAFTFLKSECVEVSETQWPCAKLWLFPVDLSSHPRLACN